MNKKKQEQFNNSDYTQSLIKNAKGSTGMFYANNDYFVPPKVQRYLTSQQQTTIISTSNDNNSDKNTKSIEEEEGEFNEFVEMLRQSNHPSAIPLNSMHTFYNKQNNQQQQQQFNSSGNIVDPKLVFEQSNQYAPRMMMLNEDDDSTTTTTTTPTTTTTTTDTTTPLTIDNTNNNNDSNNTINSQQQSFMYSDEQFMNQMELFEQYKQFNQQMNASQMDEQRHIQLLQLKDQLKLTSQIYQTCYHRCLGHKSHHLNLRLYMGQKMDQKKSSNGQDEEEYILSVNEKESIVECVNKEYDTFERTRKQFLNHFISKNQNEYSEMANHVYQYVHSAPSSSSSSQQPQQNTKLNRFQQSTVATAPFLLPTTDNSSSSNTSGSSSSSSTTGGGSALGRLVAPSPPSSNQKQQ